MGFLKKWAKKGLLKVGRLGLAAVTGGQSEAVIRTAQAASKGLQLMKAKDKLGKVPALALRSSQEKTKTPTPQAAKQLSAAAVAMPGGAPIKESRSARKGSTARRSSSRGSQGTRPKTKSPKTSSKRRPPSGGLDLAALSKSWAAAGRPGTWRGWIAKNKKKAA